MVIPIRCRRPSPSRSGAGVVAVAVALVLAGCGTGSDRPSELASDPAENPRAAIQPPRHLSAAASPAAGGGLQARADRLVEAALVDGKAFELLEDLIAHAPQRHSGTDGAEAAVEWGVATMRALGFRNVRREAVVVPRWERGVERAEVVGIPGLADADRELTITALGGSVPTPEGGLEADVVMVRTFEELRAMGDRAKGKLVFFNRPMPRALRNTFRAYSEAVPQRSNGAVEAALAGGVGALVRSMTTAVDDFPHTGAMNYDDAVARVPAAAISTVDADALAARLAAGPVRVRMELTCRSLDDVASANVVGEIVGAERPEEIVVVGAHLDAWDLGQGAHDDGAGCAHVLEAGRLILASGLRPRRTIRFVLFMNEEFGLRGGRAYEAAHREAMGRHVAAFESDAGGFEPKGFNTSLTGEAHAALQPLFEPLRSHGMGALLPGGGGGADISPMRPHGVPLFGMIVTSHRYFDVHHSARDTIDEVNERELALGAAALAYAVSILAECP